MGKVYDDWERLVEAVLRREKLRQLCYDHSRTPSQSSSDSISLLDDDSGRTSSLHLQATMAIFRLQEELINTLTQNKQCFDHGCISSRTCEENSMYEQSIVSFKHDSVQNASRGEWNKQCFDHGCISSRTCEENSIYEQSIVSFKHNSVQNASRGECSSTEREEYIPDLLHPDMIPQIKSIANVMFASCYDQEFCQAFIGFGIGAFAEYLTILNVEDISVEDVLKMEWRCLNSRIKKWCLASKNFIGHYLVNAKYLFDQVLEGYEHISSRCLIEASKSSVMCLLNFGHAVTIVTHQPELLYCLLEMYEVLAALIPNVDFLFPEDIDSFIRTEFYNLLTRLGNCAKVNIKKFGNHISSSSSTSPLPNGGIHPLTRYVINYILRFAEYDDTLNLLLEEEDEENLNKGPNEDLEQNISGPVAVHVQSLTSVLETNIDNKSNIYRDNSLKHIFMMNNIHYMVEKIRNSKIRMYFGDERIKSHIRKLQFHAMSYQRNTWSSILPLLRYDGKANRATLKARCRDFTLAFEDVYKNQTGWCVPNLHLREELRISASITVVRAYRNFFIKTPHSIGDKHIKYTEHDLEIYILDLLEGSSKSLIPSRKGQKN